MHRLARAALVSLAATGLAAAAPSAARAAEPCPADTLTCSCLMVGPAIVSTAPGQSCGGDWKAGNACDGACYDLRLGLLQVVANRSLSCLDEAAAHDVYTLAGVPPGAPLVFFAQLHVMGMVSGSATARVVLAEGPLNGAAASYSAADSPVDDTILIPLYYGLGESFPLHLRLRAELGATPGMADLTASLEFLDLPEGARVESCQGYTMPVPTVPSTWARVKSTYR
jgi:hypothetical protein